MDRRGFIKGTLGSGALGAVPLAGLAGSAVAGEVPVREVTVASQRDASGAAGLTAGIVAALEAGGVRVAALSLDSEQLADFATVSGIIEGGRGGALVGVMDDASAVIFQQIAASRGAGWLIGTHHRFDGLAVRQCCSVAGLESPQNWSEPVSGHIDRIARLYGQALSPGRKAGAATPAGAQTVAGFDGPASLMSFVITA